MQGPDGLGRGLVSHSVNEQLRQADRHFAAQHKHAQAFDQGLTEVTAYQGKDRLILFTPEHHRGQAAALGGAVGRDTCAVGGQVLQIIADLGMEERNGIGSLKLEDAQIRQGEREGSRYSGHG